MTLLCRGFAFKIGITHHLVIVHVFERVADHADAHVDEVRGSHLKNLLRELLPVFVDLLRGEDVGLESVHVRGVSRAAVVDSTLKQPTSTVRWAMMARWWPSSVSKAIWAISPSDLPINIWQAAASICLF